jgi:hypothetical protein
MHDIESQCFRLQCYQMPSCKNALDLLLAQTWKGDLFGGILSAQFGLSLAASPVDDCPGSKHCLISLYLSRIYLYNCITLYIMYYTVLWCIVNLWILCLILSRWKYSINSSPCAWVSMMLRSMTVKCTSCHLRSTRNRRINRLSFNVNMFFYPEIRDDTQDLANDVWLKMPA